MNEYHCVNCKFFEDRSTDKLLAGHCKKYSQPLNFYDWWEKCDMCIKEGKMMDDKMIKAVEK